MKNSLPIDTLKIIYFACDQTTISCGIRWGKNKISNPSDIVELFNSYFVEIV